MALKPIHQRVRKHKGWKLAYVEALSPAWTATLSRTKTGKLEPTLRVLEMLAELFRET